MENNNLNNAIPRSLEECVEPGYTAINLHRWAERLDLLGRIFFWILISAGSVHTIAITAVNAELNEEMALSTFVFTVITWGIIVVVEYAIYKIAALSINAMAVIVHNTMISANVALFESYKSMPPVPDSGSKSNSNSLFAKARTDHSTGAKSWKCTCGRENAAYVSTCACGKSARENRMNQSELQTQ